MVQAKVGCHDIRFINGYGPQEYCKIEDRIQFYARLEQEVVNAKLFGNKVCIEMDANAKVGSEIIENDPNLRSCNGTMLVELCERNNLIICNATQLCEGVITRQRDTVNCSEKSVIDYLILCEEMFSYLSSMKIDEARLYVLTKYSKVRGKTVMTQSDHNPIIARFNCLWNSDMTQGKQRTEIFNFKDPEGIMKYNQLTSSDTLLSCLRASDVKQCGKKWLKAFRNILHRSFKKVRITNKKLEQEEVHRLMRAKTQVLEKLRK